MAEHLTSEVRSVGKQRPRVAVLDDDHEFAALMEVLLEEEGFSPVCPDLAEADPADALATGAYDLAILDVHGVAGHDLTLLQRLRNDPRLNGLPILVCSADIQLLRENAALFSSMPATAGLEKPFRIDALAGALHRLLDGSLSATPGPAHSRSGLMEAIEAWLADLGRTLHWAALDAWIPDESPGQLRCAAAWCASSRFEPFARVSRRTHLPFGGGLPGGIWVSGRPAWVEDVASDLNFPRLPTARRVGLVSAAAAPVLDGAVTLGVVVAYTTMRRARDSAVVEQLQVAATGAVDLFRAVSGSPAEA